MEQKLSTLRAGVLGANDGILTVVGVLFSVAVATTNQFTIFIAGLSDLLACAFSMASGEYASVSTQREAEKAAVQEEKKLLKTDFSSQLLVVKNYYIKQGVSENTSLEIAHDLLKKKPLETTVWIKHGIKLKSYVNPWHAAYSSLISASSGGIFPLAAMSLTPRAYQWQATIVAVCFSVALTGFLSAKLGNGMVKISVIRNLLVGIVTMIIHYSLGILI